MTAAEFSEKLLDRARQRVMAITGHEPRRWLVKEFEMYNGGVVYGQVFRVEVLEGTPPRGWITALVSGGHVQWVDAYRDDGRRLNRYSEWNTKFE